MVRNNKNKSCVTSADVRRMKARKNKPVTDDSIVNNWNTLKKIGGAKNNNCIAKTKSKKLSLEDGMWKGRRCFIVGGGASLKGFDFSKLDGELVIGINRAIEKMDPTILFSLDYRFYDWTMKGELGDNLFHKFVDYKGLKVFMNLGGSEEYPTNIMQIGSAGLDNFTHSIKNGIGHGNNSGYSALNLAVCLGADPIYLLGFDMQGDGEKQTWWHDGYPAVQPEKVFVDFCKHFDLASDKISKKGIEVINLSSDSKLECFKKGDIKDVPALKDKNIFVDGYLGFGDNLYQLPFVRHLAKKYKTVYVRTPIPEIYHSIKNVKFVNLEVNLRTQKKHIENQIDIKFYDIPKDTAILHWPHYWKGYLQDLSITEYFNLTMPLTEYDYLYKPKQEWIEDAKRLIKSWNTKKKICIIHRPTIRNEWKHYSRNARPEYYQLILDNFPDDYYYVDIADVEEGKEWFVKPEVEGIDRSYIHGEIPIRTLLGLMYLSNMVITSNSFFMAMGIFMNVKTFTLFGGSQKPKYFRDPRMDLNNYEEVKPYPFCNCLLPKHNCNTYIPENHIINKFAEFSKGIHKKNLLISRIPPADAVQIAKNKYLLEHYNIYTIDMTRFTEKYKGYENLFSANLSFVPGEGRATYNDLLGLLKEYKIDIVLNSQPYFHLANKMNEACKELGIKSINVESFFDDSLVYDYTGIQYSPQNDIEKYMSIFKYNSSNKVSFPAVTREPQPEDISKENLYSKYHLGIGKEYIVILGQKINDMSLKMSNSLYVNDYKAYINALTQSNPDVTFLFKKHPFYETGKDETEFVSNIKNVVPVYESLDTLFEYFNYFSAFSSTTILEGLLKDKKFATAGNHYVNNGKLVYQLLFPESYFNLYDKLQKFNIDEDIKKRYIQFIYNHYAIRHTSKKLYDKITKTPEEYYGK